MFYEGFGLECAQCETVGFVIDFHLTTKNKNGSAKSTFYHSEIFRPCFYFFISFHQKSL